MSEQTSTRESFSVARRVARGFFRISMTGLAIGIIGGVSCDVIALMQHRSDLIVSTDLIASQFPQSLSDDQISKALVQTFGEPKPKPWSEYVLANATPDAFPYASNIAAARQQISTNVESAQQFGWIWMLFGVGWATVWLVLSWIIRGFMSG